MSAGDDKGEDKREDKSYDVEHVTRYMYGAPVVHARHQLHLSPRDTLQQQVLTHELLSDSGSAKSNGGGSAGSARTQADTDAFGNSLTRVELEYPHQQLTITARSRVAIQPPPEVVASESLSWERVRDELSYNSRPRTPRELEAVSFRQESPHIRIKNVFGEFAEECFARGQPALVCAENLMHKIHRELTYAPGTTQINTSLLAVLEARRGVCQDFSHLMIAALRSLGLAARYVSGYLRTVPLDTGPALVGADASHAWVSVYVPPFGWIDLDPTNDVRVSTDHITLAWGRDFSDVSPVRGVIIGGGSHEVSVGVTVSSIKQPA